jgi:membrane dipeptidase
MTIKTYLSLIICFISFSCVQEMKKPEKVMSDEELKLKADSLAKNFIIIDTHVDIPYRLTDKWEDISQRTENGDFDYPRALKGGLNAPFVSIYVPADLEKNGGSKQLADSLINMVEEIVNEHPDKFALAYTVADVTNTFNSSKRKIISFPLGMENGSPVEGNIKNLKYFYDRGIRYITLAHSRSNHICDSSYDKERKWNGLSPFGKKVVEEMNRLGIMIDVSHISDSAFYQVIKYSKAPVIASHSSCRYFTPGWERNMSDEMIKKLAENGGVIQINFGSDFLNDDIRKKSEAKWDQALKHVEEKKLKGKDANDYIKNYMHENHPGYADIKDVVAHINHVVKLAGIDYVGFGSDFEGVGDSLPEGLKDVSFYPNLIYHLLKEGYSDEDIEKICSGNILRVWSEVERISGE